MYSVVPFLFLFYPSISFSLSSFLPQVFIEHLLRGFTDTVPAFMELSCNLCFCSSHHWSPSLVPSSLPLQYTSVQLLAPAFLCLGLLSVTYMADWKCWEINAPPPPHTDTASFNQWLEYIITPAPLSPWGEATLTCSLCTRSQNSAEGSVLVTYSGNLFNNERFICSLFFSVSFPLPLTQIF